MLSTITYRDIFDSTSNGIIATNAQGRITLINQKAVRILDLKKNAALGADVRDVLPMTGRHIFDCLKTGQPQIGRHVRGSKVSLVVNVTPVRKNRTICGTVSNFQKMEQFEHSAQQLESYIQLNNQLKMDFPSMSLLPIRPNQASLIRLYMDFNAK